MHETKKFAPHYRWVGANYFNKRLLRYHDHNWTFLTREGLLRLVSHQAAKQDYQESQLCRTYLHKGPFKSTSPGKGPTPDKIQTHNLMFTWDELHNWAKTIDSQNSVLSLKAGALRTSTWSSPNVKFSREKIKKVRDRKKPKNCFGLERKSFLLQRDSNLGPKTEKLGSEIFRKFRHFEKQHRILVGGDQLQV